jgi:serine/threonine-protein kinase
VSGDQRLPDPPRYRLDARIATGGMGEVWKATDTVLGREVAVKVLKREYADDATFRSRFETEARNAAALHHPNVAAVFDFGELPGEGDGPPQPYLVMELVRGEPLSALLRGGEPMPPEPAAELLAQAADGVSAAHALGIVHRDVKPANLLVMPDGTVKITDFGIARAADAVALTQTGQVIGTPQYLSPEQAEGKAATEASDIYSLGVVLYECLAGRRPFDADSPIATALAHLREDPPPLPDEVPEHLREIVRVALAKDPAARFGSAAAFATALHGGPVVGGAGSPTDPGAEAPTVVAGAPVAGAALAAAAADRDADDGTRVLGRSDDVPPGSPGGGPSGPEPGPAPVPAERRRTPAWLPWVAAAAVVLVVVLVVAQLGGNGDDPGAPTGTGSSPTASKSPARPSRSASPKPSPSRTPTPSDTASESASPSESPSESPSGSPSGSPSAETVTVDPATYVGRPKGDATRDLQSLGLRVAETTVDNPGDQQKDVVSGVSPSGEVDKGSTVTLSVYGDPPTAEAPGQGNDQANGKAKGKGKKQR